MRPPRSIKIAVWCLLLTLCTGLCSAGQWPQFLGPTADSKSTETGILTKWPAAGPRIVWKRELGTSYGLGSISKGRLYQFDRFGDGARLYCLDARTGGQLWQFEYPIQYDDLLGYNNGPRTTPLVDGDRVYLHGVEGTLYCVSTKSGKEIWQVDTIKQFGVVKNFFGVGSSPVIEGNLLIVNVGGSPAESQQFTGYGIDKVVGNGSGVVAFDKYTGKVKYQRTNELASYATPKLATIGGRRWCFVFARGGLIGMEPSTGKLDFHYPWRATDLESVNASGPVVVGNEVFISETYGPGSSLLRVKPGGYEVVWRDPPEDARVRRSKKTMQTHWNTPIYHEGYLYGSSGRHSNNAELRCIEWKTGKVMWSQPGLSRCSLLYVDGHFVCLAEYGVLRLLRATPEKYDVVAQTTLQPIRADAAAAGSDQYPLLKYPAWSAPMLVDGLLYVRGKSQLVCLELIPEKR